MPARDLVFGWGRTCLAAKRSVPPESAQQNPITINDDRNSVGLEGYL